MKQILRRRDEIGATAIIVALFFSFVALPLGAVGVDVARLYVELERVQAAADAAATAGVTYMPDDFVKAKARALEVAKTNGYPNLGDSAVLVEAGDKPTQLKVTVSSTVDNAFASSFGVPTSTMSRSAVADFNGPAPMGSPCNTYGNEPPGTVPRPYETSQLSAPPNAVCSSKPMFWASAAGPNVFKTQGEQFGTRYCEGGESNCAGSTNKDFDPNGYFYLIRVGPDAAKQPIRVQIFDPAYVPTGSRCDDSRTDQPNYMNWNSYTPGTPLPRYTRSATDYCTGDNPNSSSQRVGSETPTVTSFGLRAPIDTLQPKQAPPVLGCAKQYPGWNINDYDRRSYRSGSGYYDDRLARVFHHWVTMCEFTPAKAGDYYLQVRTNVPLGGTYDYNGGYNNTAIFSQAGDNTSERGNGTNRYGLRAVPVSGSKAAAAALSVSPWERMPIFANSDSASTTFNLVRVIPAAANKTLVFSFFDVGESSAASGGTMKVLPPVDSALPTDIPGCTGSGKITGDLSKCQITGIKSSAGWDGQYQEIRVPIPKAYTCASGGPGGCWFRVQVSFPGATVTDATTWTARIVGEPVRLIE